MASRDDNRREASVTEMLQEQVRAELLLSRRLADFKGRWVAVRDHDVVEDADSLDELVELVDADAVDAMFEVPRERAAAVFVATGIF